MSSPICLSDANGLNSFARSQIWRIPLDVQSPSPDCLTEDELARVSRFSFEDDRNRFVCVRSALRTILAGVLAGAPGDVAFVYSKHGKPSLDPRHDQQIRFNVSHTPGAALIAVAWGSEIGVDIEMVRAVPDLLETASRLFAPAEIDALRSLPEADRERAFFTCWTRKEACIKAWGGGLAVPLDRFDVPLVQENGPFLIGENRCNSAMGSQLVLFGVEFDPAYVAAVAIER